MGTFESHLDACPHVPIAQPTLHDHLSPIADVEERVNPMHTKTYKGFVQRANEYKSVIYLPCVDSPAGSHINSGRWIPDKDTLKVQIRHSILSMLLKRMRTLGLF